MTHFFTTLTGAAMLTCAALCARGDALPQAERVMLRSTEGLPVVDRLVVRKGERRLLLLHGEAVVRSYKVALGLNPVGQKERSGDFRTPEGHYRLGRRNARSDYFLSIQVSYPNEADVKRGRARHWEDRKSTRLNSSHDQISYAVFCLKKKKKKTLHVHLSTQ